MSKTNFLLYSDDDEMYTEAQKLIKKCREKKLKKLDFSKLYRLKEIPPEITELETLEELNIRISCLLNIPAFIGNIISLKKLSIGSEYSSHHPDKREEIILPAELGNLRNLQYLSLGYDIPEIPRWVWTLDKLEELEIYNDFIKTISSGLGELNRLRRLRIAGEKIASLPDEMGQMPSLAVLELKCEKLLALPDSFSNLKAMEEFSFNECNLSAIPDFICNWVELNSLTINMSNTFQGPYTELKSMPKNIGNLKKLVYLFLDWTSFTKISDSLGSCPLEHLELTGDYKTIPQTFGNLSKLENLKLRSTKAINLPDSFGELSALKKLDISTPALKIPDSFVKLAALEDLDIMTEDVVLPKNFGSLSSLKDLSINSPKLQNIPDFIGECKDLKHIYIDSDKLAALPESFCKLKKLERLHLDTFALKSLPTSFGKLAALKSIYIFSGAMTALPESMEKLKNIECLNLDLHNLNELPDWLKVLPCAQEKHIQTAREEVSLYLPQKKRKLKLVSPYFNDLAKMNYNHRWKILEAYPVKKIEAILCSAPSHWHASYEEKDVFKNIMLARRRKLNRKFRWTEENKKRVVKVSDGFLKAWEEGIAKAKAMLDFLYEKDRDSFKKTKKAQITLYPEILIEVENGKLYANHLYDVITSYLNPEFELNMFIEYDPETKDEEKLHKDIFICRDLSWNIEGFGDLELQDCYSSYSLHVLYSHNNWANEDVLKVNNIITEVRITYEDNIGHGS